MKKLLILMLCVGALGVSAQNEGDSLVFTPDSLTLAHMSVVSSMDGIGYKEKNDAIYKIDIQDVLSRADSVFVGIDDDTICRFDPQKKVIVISKTSMKKAIVYLDGKDGVVEIFMTAKPFMPGYKTFICDYASYLDSDGFVHELDFDHPVDKLVLYQFGVYLRKHQKN